MNEQLLRELESAAHILLSPPNLVNSEQRHSAEAVFINFRKMNAPYEFCKYILATTKVDYVLFEAAGLIKEAGVREWAFMPSSEIHALRNHLLRYVIERPTLAPFVREKLLQVIAVMIKRQSVEDCGSEQRKLIQEVQQLISNGSLPQQLIGCGIVAAMIQEYEGSTKSADMGLSNNDHTLVKQQFEKTDLRDFFGFAVRALHECVRRDTPQQLMKHLVSITSSVLCWNFHNYFQTVNIFFEVYWKVRNDPQLAHHAMTCLSQLASISGPIWDGVAPSERRSYFTNYLQSFFNLLHNIKVLDREALGVATVLHHVASQIENLTPDLINNYFDHLTHCTCLFGEGAAEEESMCVENTYYMEAFTRLLTTWLTVFDNFFRPSVSAPSKDFKRNACVATVKVIETYLQCHLSPPIGVRGLGREIEAEEIDELDEEDRVKFCDQLECLGFLARQTPEHVLPLLARLMEDCTGRIFSQLQRMSSQAVQISDHRIMENLSEDIHWLLLLAGHTLTMNATGESPLIPSEIMQYSIKQFDSVDLDVTLKVLTSPEQYIHNIQGADESTDHVVRLVAAVFRLCELERRAFEAKLENFMSPQVGCTILWFLHRWSLSYFIPNEQYSQMSVAIMTCFGKDTEAAAWVANFLLNKVESNLEYAIAEPSLVKETVDTLTALVNSKDKASYVLKTQGYLGIMNLQEVCLSDVFPQHARRGYFKALMQASCAFRETEDSVNYLRKVVEPTLSKFKALLGQENFVRNFHEARNKNIFMNCFDAFIGMTEGSAGERNIIAHLATFLNPVFSELPSLVSLYSNYPEIIEVMLQLLCQASGNMILYLSNENTNILAGASLQTMQAFSKCNSNRMTLENCSEDDSFKDIQLILKILSNLLSKDFCDFSFDQSDSSHKTTDIVIAGLFVITPLMSADLLKCPDLCTQFYHTLAYVCDVAAQKMTEISDDLFKQLLSAIEIGLRSCIPEVQNSCFSFVSSVTSLIPIENSQDHPFYNYLKQFFHIIFDLAILQKVPSEIEMSLCRALYYLIMRYRDDYREAVASLIHSQTNPAVAERLKSVFAKLNIYPVKCMKKGHWREKEIFTEFAGNFNNALPVLHGMFIK